MLNRLFLHVATDNRTSLPIEQAQNHRPVYTSDGSPCLYRLPSNHGMSICCDDSSVAQSILRQTDTLAFPDTSIASTVVIDAPTGFALAALESPPTIHTVVMTWNGCPEYWEDLWDLQPHSLVASDHMLIDEVIRRTAAGEHGRFLPPRRCRLSQIERCILRGAAQGYTNHTIGIAMGTTDKNVDNTLTRVYSKIGVSNRLQASHYYWGIWSAQRRWR